MKIFCVIPLLISVPAAYGWTPASEPPEIDLSLFSLPAGLEVTTWAASPDLQNPTNMDIDHEGRIWVTEAVNYRGQAGRRPEGDRIVVLEDQDGDGHADRSQVFWQDPELLAPLGIAVFDNVVYVSQPPHLLKLTDVNRDLSFDPADGDIREVVLTGFNGRNHDHSLHSVTGGPDGKLYFNQGNCGAIFEDQSGNRFPIGSAYYRSGGGEWPFNTAAVAGQTSADGFSYVGGFTVRMNPDATDVEIIGHGYRNSYEQTVTSLGHVFQSDNDDRASCRTGHILEYGNAGFFSRNGKRFWSADRRPGQDVPTSHWRQEDPGVMPAGDIYGGGSPTGIVFYENGALGEAFEGVLFLGEPGRNVIFAYKPDSEGAGFDFGNRIDFLTTNPEKNFDGTDFTGGVRKQREMPKDDTQMFLFRPSDVSIGPDGALYITDWYDPRVGGHDTQDSAAAGMIYRVAPKGFQSVVPEIDLDTLEGAIAALKSPAVNVRWLGFQRLKAAGADAFEMVSRVLEHENRYVAARAIWLMPYLGDQGLAKLDQLLEHPDEMVRLTAFRAIRRTDGAIDALPYAKDLSTDASPAVRAEAALAMRYRPFEEARSVLINVAKGYDGKDRSYLESLGYGTGHHNNELWNALLEALDPGEPAEWSDTFARLTWRLMPEDAIEALKARASASGLTLEQRKLAIDSLAFIHTPGAADALIELAMSDSELHDDIVWWLKNRNEGAWSSFNLGSELIEKGILEPAAALVEVIVPGREEPSFTVEEVMELDGLAARGQVAAKRCIVCHKIDGVGPDYGPALKGFGSRNPPEVIAQAIVDPSADIAQGFDGTALQLQNDHWIDGLILADGDPVVIQSTGGIIQEVPAEEIKFRKPMDRSLMLNADQLGLTAQQVADIIEWLKTY